MDANVTAAIITALVALIGVLAVVLFRRNGSEGNGAQRRGDQLLQVFQISNEALREVAVTQAQIVATQEQIVTAIGQVVEKIGRLVEQHIGMEKTMAQLDNWLAQRARGREAS